MAGILDIDSDYDFEIEDGDNPMLRPDQTNAGAVDQVPQKSSAPANLATDASVATFGLRKLRDKSPLTNEKVAATPRVSERQPPTRPLSNKSAMKIPPPSKAPPKAPAKAITTFIPATPSTVTAESAIESLQKQMNQMKTEYESRYTAQAARISDLTKQLSDSNETSQQLNLRMEQLTTENQQLRSSPNHNDDDAGASIENVEMVDAASTSTTKRPDNQNDHNDDTTSPPSPDHRSIDRPLPDDVSTPDSKRHKKWC